MPEMAAMRNIYKVFGGLCANNNVCLSINKGEVIGLVGDNAAGKSTLMKVLAGVHMPSSGELSVEGRPVVFRSPKDARKYSIEMLFQDLALVPELDITDNLFLGREVYKKVLGGIPLRYILDKKLMKKMSREFLSELGIDVQSVDEKVKNLSGGQRQSVAISRAIFFNSKLVILDEPTSAISVRETRKVLELIVKLKRKGISVIIVSHRMEDIFAVADRVVVLRRGTKVADVEKDKTSLEEVIKYIIGAEGSHGN
jgi:simple sugar transport system ATP-binding protein